MRGQQGDSTSYVCVDVAKQLLGTLPQSVGIVAWLNEDEFSDQDRERSLNMSTTVISLSWKGSGAL